MDIFRFDRFDRIATELMLGLFAATAAASLLLEPVSRWIRGLPLLIASGEANDGHVAVEGATASERIIMLVAPTVAVVFLLIGSWLMIKFLRGIMAGEPFARVQIRRLRALAMLLIVVPTALTFAMGLATSVVQDRLGLDVGVAMTLPLPWLLGGLLTAAVAQAFAAGAALRDDVEGLI